MKLARDEQQLLFSLALGDGYGEMVQATGLSYKTIATRFDRIIKPKLGVRTLHGLIKPGFENGDLWRPSRINRIHKITEEELVVLWLLFCDKTNREISDQLLLSESTIEKNRVGSIKKKLYARSRTNAVYIAHGQGLLRRPPYDGLERYAAKAEQRAIEAVAESRDVSSAAKQLGLSSSRPLEYYIDRAMHRYDAKNLAHLVALALRAGELSRKRSKPYQLSDEAITLMREVAAGANERLIARIMGCLAKTVQSRIATVTSTVKAKSPQHAVYKLFQSGQLS